MCDEYGGADDFESDEEPLDEVPEEDLDTKPGKSHIVITRPKDIMFSHLSNFPFVSADI